MSRIADRLGIKYHTFMRMLNQYDNYQLPVLLLIPFINSTNDFSLLDHIEKQLGRVAIHMPENSSNIDAGSIAKLAKESGEAMVALSNAIIDKKFTRRERDQCTKELMDMVQHGWVLIRKLQEGEI